MNTNIDRYEWAQAYDELYREGRSFISAWDVEARVLRNRAQVAK